jgi:TolA-binding protein
MERFGAQWTPTIQILDSNGVKRHQIEGFLPTKDFLAQLKLGLAHATFGQQRFAEAEQRFREIAAESDSADAIPEALYWAGVAKYKATNDANALKETADKFRTQFPESSWAKKASVWAA